MKCCVRNINSVAVLVDFVDGTEQFLLSPGDEIEYDDSFEVPSDETMVLVHHGFVRLVELVEVKTTIVDCSLEGF